MIYKEATDLINAAKKIIIIQAENPDGDSLASSLALEEILGDLGKESSLYCSVEIPKYMRYITGWDRVTKEFDSSYDLAIIVDTNTDTLLSKMLNQPDVRNYLETHPVLVIDHHITPVDLSFRHALLTEDTISTSEIIYNISKENNWSINSKAAENILIAIMSDSLGFSSESLKPSSFLIASELMELGAVPAAIENRRREYMKKSPEILAYKGELLGRIEYMLDGKLALIHIPWEEIKKYSDQYNPSVLVLDEMRLVENVELAVAIKTYPDGRVTGKLRGNIPIAEEIAKYFGGGGHVYAAGFRVYDDYDKIIREMITAVDKSLKEYHLNGAKTI